MKEYDKIETIYERDLKTQKLIDGKFWNPTVEYLKDNDWVFTEKIDGTNIRVVWDGHRVSFYGRTDKAEIPAPLLNKLNELFGGNEHEEIFEQLFADKQVVLYGEGYGAGIQNGGDYIKDGVDFILFDVEINGIYLEEQNMEDIASKLCIKSVPVIGYGRLIEGVSLVKAHPLSLLPGTAYMEGVVAKPALDLKDRLGKRIIVKIKYEDFKKEGGATECIHG